MADDTVLTPEELSATLAKLSAELAERAAVLQAEADRLEQESDPGKVTLAKQAFRASLDSIDASISRLQRSSR